MLVDTNFIRLQLRRMDLGECFEKHFYLGDLAYYAQVCQAIVRDLEKRGRGLSSNSKVV